MAKTIFRCWSVFLLLAVVGLAHGAERVLKVGVLHHSPPMSYVDASGGLTGFNVEIMRELCKELAVIEYKFAAGLAESILILSKKEMRDKGIKSPDAADAANYATMWIELDDGMPLGTVFMPDYDGNEGFGIYSSSNSFW